jgi:4-amino-4-deoxy-L-arabinose transferase-like glycosyltransferase
MPQRIWFGVVVLVLAAVQRETAIVDSRTFLLVVAATLAGAAWHVRRRLREPPGLLIHAALAVLTLLIAASPALAPSNPEGMALLPRAVAPVLAGWLFYTLMLSERATESPRAPTRASAWGPAAVAVAAFATFAIAHAVIAADFVTFFDEPLYVLQGRLMGEPGFVRRMDDALKPFFVLRQTLFESGHFYTQYPPGHPWALAAFDAIGLRWWVGVAGSTAGVAFTYLLGRAAQSELAGRVGALLLATNEYFITYGTSYMPHGVNLACGACAAWLLVRSESWSRRRRLASWAGSGLLLGFMTASRPLTGVGLGASLVGWQLMRERFRWRGLLAPLACGAAGAAIPLVALLHFNHVTNGSPLLFGYTALHGSLHNLGFGLRGFVTVDAQGQLTLEVANFTLKRALINTLILAHVWPACWRRLSPSVAR